MRKNLSIHIVSSQGDVEYYLLGEYDSEKKIIRYVDPDGITSMYLDIKSQKLVRENDEILIECFFSKKERSYQKITLKEYQQTLEVPLETKKFIVSEYSIQIEYIIDKKDIILYEIQM